MNTTGGLSPTKRNFAAWILWIALIQTVVVYYFVVKTTVPTPTGEGVPTDTSNLKMTFLILGSVLLLVSIVIRFTVTIRKPAIAWPSYIASLALTEVSGVFGLILGFLGVPLTELYPFFGIALLGLIAQPPTVLSKPA